MEEHLLDATLPVVLTRVSTNCVSFQKDLCCERMLRSPRGLTRRLTLAWAPQKQPVLSLLGGDLSEDPLWTGEDGKQLPVWTTESRCPGTSEKPIARLG